MQSTRFSFSSFFLITNVKIAKTATHFWFFKAFVYIMIFLFANVVFDMAQVLGLILILFCYLSDIDLNGWMTSSPFFLAFFRAENLNLRLISKRKRIIKLSLFFVPIDSLIALLLIGVVFVFFDQRLYFFEYQKLIFLVSKDGWRPVFTSTSIAFSITLSHISKSRFWLSNWAQIDGCRLSQK